MSKSKLLLNLLATLIFLIFPFLTGSSVYAATGTCSMPSNPTTDATNMKMTFVIDTTKVGNLQISGNPYAGQQANFTISSIDGTYNKSDTETVASNGTATFTVDISALPGANNYSIGVATNNGFSCQTNNITVPNLGQTVTTGGQTGGSAKLVFNPSNPAPNQSFTAIVSSLPEDARYFILITPPSNNAPFCTFSSNKQLNFNVGSFPGNSSVSVIVARAIDQSASGGCVSDGRTVAEGNIQINSGSSTSTFAAKNPCSVSRASCTTSGFAPCNNALGLCIDTSNPTSFVQGLMTFATGIAGGIALILMGFGAIGMITSQGNAEALKAAQGRFTSAIIGLLFIIFSVFLLHFIGVNILAIPGFS